MQVKAIKRKLSILEANSAFSQSCPEAIEIHKELLREKRYVLVV